LETANVILHEDFEVFLAFVIKKYTGSEEAVL
jgi:hypothetical protein